MIKTNKVVAVAILLLVLCILPGATNINLGYPQTFKSVAGRISFDQSMAEPGAFVALPRGLNSEVSWDSIKMLATAPLTFFADSPWHDANTHPTPSSTRSVVPSVFPDLRRPREANLDRISFDTHALAPMAFIRFCKRYPKDCRVSRMAFRPKPVELTKARKTELVMVNREVNHAIKPQENVNGVMAEEWLVSPRAGDCNDYAVTKRHKLLARGWPSRSLLLAEVVIPSGEHHLVLVVRNREDDLVLDNLNPQVRSVSQAHYEWVRAQETKNPKFWSKVSVKRAAQVVMNLR